MTKIKLTPEATVLEAGDSQLSVSLTREVRWTKKGGATTRARVGSFAGATVLAEADGQAQIRIRARVCVQRPHGLVRQEVVWDDLAPGRSLPELVDELVALIAQVLEFAGAAPSRFVPGSVATIVAAGGRPGIAGGCLVRALAWAAAGALQVEPLELDHRAAKRPDRWRDAIEAGSGLQPRRDSRGC
jgi:hypothetical protein